MERGDQPDSSRSRTEIVAELALALGVVAIGALVLWQTNEIRVAPTYSRIGPRVVPTIVGAGLILLGLWLAADVLTGHLIVGAGLILLGLWLAADVLTGHLTGPSEESEDADPTLPTDWRTVGLLAASLVVYLLLIERAGFVIASALLFTGAAFAMGSRHPIRDALLGLAVAVVLYIGFTEGLDLRLPAGWLEGIS